MSSKVSSGTLPQKRRNLVGTSGAGNLEQRVRHALVRRRPAVEVADPFDLVRRVCHGNGVVDLTQDGNVVTGVPKDHDLVTRCPHGIKDGVERRRLVDAQRQHVEPVGNRHDGLHLGACLGNEPLAVGMALLVTIARDGGGNEVDVRDVLHATTVEVNEPLVLVHLLLRGTHHVAGVEEVGVQGEAHEEHPALGLERVRDALEPVVRNDVGLHIFPVHAHALAVGHDPRHEAGLVHVEEAHELHVVAPRVRAKVDPSVDYVVDSLERARRDVARAKRDERVVHVGENELDQGDDPRKTQLSGYVPS